MVDNRQVRREPEWLVWLVVVIALGIGWWVKDIATSRSQHITVEGVSLSYPDGWVRAREVGTLFATTDLQAGPFGPRVSLRNITLQDLLPNGDTADETDIALAWSLRRGQGLTGYRVLSLESTAGSLSDSGDYKVGYAYVAEPPVLVAGGLPALMQGIDTVRVLEDQVYILSFVAESDSFDAYEALQERITAQWILPR